MQYSPEIQCIGKALAAKIVEIVETGHDKALDKLHKEVPASLEEMLAAAKRRGLRYIAITDHSKRLTAAHGLDADRLLAQIK